MGSGVVPPGLLVQPAQLSRYNVPSDFLAQFDPVPFQVQVSTAGALGVAQFVWKRNTDSAWSAPIASSAGTTWSKTFEDVFADLAFGAATYVALHTAQVDTAGNVTAVVGTLAATLAAALFSLPLNTCSSVTSEALMRMRDAIRPPLLRWGDDATMHAAQMVYGALKRGRGATPDGAGAGDDRLFSGEDMGRKFFDDIGENGRPDSMTDSSPTADGPMLAAKPVSDCRRGW